MIFTEAFDDSGLDLIGSIPTVPEYASIYESDSYMNEAMECDYNDLFMSVGLQELGAFQEAGGQDVVYEAADFKALKDKVVTFFKKQWARIQGLFDSFMDKMVQASKKFKETVLKAKGGKDGILKGAEKFQADTVYYRGYDYHVVNAEMYDDACKIFSTKEALNRVENAVSVLDNYGKKGDTDDYNELLQKAKLKISDALSVNGHGTFTPEMVREKTKERLRNRSTNKFGYKGDWIKNNAKDIYDFVVDFSSTKKSTKKMLNDAKAEIEKAIKDVKASKSDVKIKAATDGYKKVLVLANAQRSAVLSCLSEKYSIYRALISKMASARGDNAKPKQVKESATIQKESVDSLFNWD